MVIKDKFTLGLILAFMVVFFDAIYDVLTRIASVSLDVKPMVFVSVVYIAAAFAMLVIAGTGKLGLKTLRDPFTWIFSFLNINLTFIFLYLFQYVTTTEGNLLVRFCIAMSLVLNILFTHKRHHWYDFLGVAFTTLGCAIIVNDLDAGNKTVVILLSVAYAAILSLRALIGEFHEPSNEAQTLKDRFRVTGYVMLVTGASFFVLSLLGATLHMVAPEVKDIGVLGSIVPQFSDFLHANTIAFATVLGMLAQMPAMFFFFYACVVGKSEVVITMTAVLPPLTLAVEYICSKLGFLTMETLSKNDIVGGAIITLSGIFLLYMKNKNKSKPIEVKVQSNQTDYEMVCSALRFCENDMLLCAKKLGVKVEDLERVHGYKGEVGFNLSGDDYRSLLRNYHRNIATADQLTGLANKDALINAMEGSLEIKEPFCVGYIDLDKFKPVNDTYGHEVGDDVLAKVAERISKTVPKDAVSARVGGDEFVVMLRAVNKVEAQQILEELVEEISSPMKIEGVPTPVSVGASFGISEAFIDAASVKKLLETADSGMYDDKKGR